jgi:hypothetical protein
MPVPLRSGVGEFPAERMGNLNAGLVSVAIGWVDLSNALDMKPERLDEGGWEKSHAISGALPFPNDHLMSVEIEILNSQPQTFEQSEPTAVQDSADDRVVAREFRENASNFLATHHDRYPAGKLPPGLGGGGGRAESVESLQNAAGPDCCLTIRAR